MPPFIENILERPLSQRLAILVGVAALIGVLFWLWLYGPQFEELGKQQEKLTELQVKIAGEHRLAMNLDKFRKEVKELDVKLKYALQQLPDQKEIPELLTQISNLATDSGLQEGLFKTKPESSREFYAEVPISINVAGSYHQVATFFDDISQASRIINISDVSMTEPKMNENAPVLKVACTATTFRYIDLEERSKQASKVDSKRKRMKR